MECLGPRREFYFITSKVFRVKSKERLQGINEVIQKGLAGDKVLPFQ